MNQPDPDFHQLRRLLSVKKHEQPPAFFFDRLAQSIRQELSSEVKTSQFGWWEALVRQFDAKPILACACGMAVAGLLVTGIRTSAEFESNMAAAPDPANPWALYSAHALNQAVEPVDSGYFHGSRGILAPNPHSTLGAAPAIWLSSATGRDWQVRPAQWTRPVD